jgi:hypothetical protein
MALGGVENRGWKALPRPVSCVQAVFGIPSGNTEAYGIPAMREWFTFETFPLTFIIFLAIMSWLSLFSVILFA